MNTVRTFWLGWGSLIAAGGGAYYFAKKSINADRQAKHEESLRKRQLMQELERKSIAEAKGAGSLDMPASPSSEVAANDPAPTRHTPTTENERVLEKSKYEASVPYRSRKGDRLGG